MVGGAVVGGAVVGGAVVGGAVVGGLVVGGVVVGGVVVGGAVVGGAVVGGAVVGGTVGPWVVRVRSPVPDTPGVSHTAASPTTNRASRLTTIQPTEVRRSSSSGSA